jgi:3',5'-cyclic AMP phosphodiesterase CpdA
MPVLTRRAFLERTVMAAAASALPIRAVWPARGAPRGGPLRLVFFTDVHARVEWDTPLALKRAAHAMNQHKADLILAGGDLITDGFESAASVIETRWKAYMELHSRLEAPLATVLGNHDLVGVDPADGSPPAGDPRASFRQHIGVDRTYRSLDAGGYHLILLDSTFITDDELKYHGRLEDAQLAWLEADLARVDNDTPIVVATHIPLLTGFYQATEGATASAPANRVVVNNRQVLDLFADHNLLLVLQGHLHVDEMLRWRDTTFITGGAVCGRWWRGPWHGTREGYGVLTLRPDRVEWQYQTYGWQAKRPPNL